jgi:hypothetical protein
MYATITATAVPYAAHPISASEGGFLRRMARCLLVCLMDGWIRRRWHPHRAVDEVRG